MHPWGGLLAVVVLVGCGPAAGDDDTGAPSDTEDTSDTTADTEDTETEGFPVTSDAAPGPSWRVGTWRLRVDAGGAVTFDDEYSSEPVTAFPHDLVLDEPAATELTSLMEGGSGLLLALFVYDDTDADGAYDWDDDLNPPLREPIRGVVSPFLRYDASTGTWAAWSYTWEAAAEGDGYVIADPVDVGLDALDLEMFERVESLSFQGTLGTVEGGTVERLAAVDQIDFDYDTSEVSAVHSPSPPVDVAVTGTTLAATVQGLPPRLSTSPTGMHEFLGIFEDTDDSDSYTEGDLHLGFGCLEGGAMVFLRYDRQPDLAAAVREGPSGVLGWKMLAQDVASVSAPTELSLAERDQIVFSSDCPRLEE